MADEHAVPQDKSNKVQGDKLDGVLEATEDQGAAKTTSVGGGHITSHSAKPVDGEGGGPIDKNPSDGKPMP